jgi:5-bromo-4-chloroindolyl phosphate hydrolysis protein
MQEAKLKQQQEYMQQHTLTPQDLRRMIAEKLERARAHARNQQKVLSKNR